MSTEKFNYITNKLSNHQIIFVIVFTFSIVYCSLSYAQLDRKAEKRQREIDQRKQEKMREAEKQYKQSLKEHYKMQSPETRRMMKRTLRKSIRESEGKQKFFLFRWFENLTTPKSRRKPEKIKPQPKALFNPASLFLTYG